MLHDLQTHFLKSIYDSNYEETVLPLIEEVNNRSLAEQLAVYRGSIYGGLKKALAQTYPVTKQLVGSDFFELMLGDYISTYPCRDQNLNDYGKELPRFIAELPQARSVRYLSDVAQLEWLYNIALNAKLQSNNLGNLTCLTPAQQQRIIFYLPRGSGLMYSDFPVGNIWDIHINSSSDGVTFAERKQFYIVYKDKAVNRIVRLTELQFSFLKMLQDGSLFTDVCNAMLKKYPTANINGLLAEAIGNNWLQSFSL